MSFRVYNDAQVFNFALQETTFLETDFESELLQPFEYLKENRPMLNDVGRLDENIIEVSFYSLDTGQDCFHDLLEYSGCWLHARA